MKSPSPPLLAQVPAAAAIFGGWSLGASFSVVSGDVNPVDMSAALSSSIFVDHLVLSLMMNQPFLGLPVDASLHPGAFASVHGYL